MHATPEPPVTHPSVRTPRADSGSVRPPHAPPWATLLERCYARAGLPLPPVARLDAEEIVQPYRALLVHSNDMTPTLEAFYRERVGLRVLGRECSPDTYLREVVLELGQSRRPVEYGAIRIQLEYLPVAAREIVLAERRPFGAILQAQAIAHMSWPQAFFAVASDSRLGHLLALCAPTRLYGRRNMLLDGNRHLLAEVLEIVAPVPEPPADPHEDAAP